MGAEYVLFYLSGIWRVERAFGRLAQALKGWSPNKRLSCVRVPVQTFNLVAERAVI